MTKKELKGHPVVFEHEGRWYAHVGWMSYFKTTLGIAPEIFIEWCRDRIKTYAT